MVAIENYAETGGISGSRVPHVGVGRRRPWRRRCAALETGTWTLGASSSSRRTGRCRDRSRVTGWDQMPLLYDFGGFSDECIAFNYPSPGETRGWRLGSLACCRRARGDQDTTFEYGTRAGSRSIGSGATGVAGGETPRARSFDALPDPPQLFQAGTRAAAVARRRCCGSRQRGNRAQFVACAHGR